MWSDSVLISGDFDENAYLRHTLHLPSYEAEQERIGQCIEAVQSQLAAAVQDAHEPLLDNVEMLQSSERAVENIRAAAGALQNSARRLRHTLHDPHDAMRRSVAQLQNVTATLDLLRLVQRFLALVAKLREGVATDLTRAARTLREIEEVLGERDLSGVEIVDRHMDFVTSASATIRSKAHDTLKAALAARDQAECSSALQCFHSLEALPRVVVSTAAEHKRDALRAVVTELDAAAVQAQCDETKDPARQRDIVFGRLENALRAVHQSAEALTVLWRVLHRKRDPVLHHTYISVLPAELRPLDDFWSAVSGQLKEKIQKVLRRGSLNALLVAEFGRYSRVLGAFCRQMDVFFRELRRTATTDSEAELVAVPAAALYGAWLHDMKSELQGQFVAHVTDRLRERMQPTINKLASLQPVPLKESVPQEVVADPRKTGGGAGQPPAAATAIDPRAFTKYVVQEMTSSRTDPDLLAITLGATATLLSQLQKKFADAQAKSPLSIPSLSTSMTTGQLFHTAIANAAATIVQELGGPMASLPLDVAVSVVGHGGAEALSAGANGAAGYRDPASGGAGASAAAAATAAATPSEALASSVARLRDALAALSETSRRVVAAFFQAATAALPRGVATAATSDDPAQGAQMERRIDHFLTRYVLLFDRATAVDAMRQQLAGAMLWKLAASVCHIRPFEELQRQRAEQCIKAITTAAAALHPHAGRQTPAKLLRQFIAVAALPVTELAATAKSSSGNSVGLPPLMILLHLFQRLELSEVVSIHTVMRRTLPDMIDETERLLQAPPTAGAAVWEAANKALAEFRQRPLSDPAAQLKRKALLEAATAVSERLLP